MAKLEEKPPMEKTKVFDAFLAGMYGRQERDNAKGTIKKYEVIIADQKVKHTSVVEENEQLKETIKKYKECIGLFVAAAANIE